MKRFFKRSIMQMIMLITASAIVASSMMGSVFPAYACVDDFPIETPLWVGPYDIDIHPELNFGFPDSGAVYWSAKCTIPEGAVLELLCNYAHARYISIHSYDALIGVPTDSLNDVQTVPDPGSHNPFLPGAQRAGNNDRKFTVTVLNEFPPEDPAQRMQNTLYAKAGDQGSLVLAWRIYVVDKNRDITGGVGLPEPRLILANGDVLEGEDAYDALSIDHTQVVPMPMDPYTYAYLRSGAAWMGGVMPPYFPALNPPDVMKVFDLEHTVTKWYMGITLPTPPYKVGQYANLDNQYMAVPLNRGYGVIAVVRGKAPSTPHTYRRKPFMDGNVQMRYWSITTNEALVTTKIVDGAYDEQIPLDDNGFYTVIVCLAEDRPQNSNLRNGVKWLDWGENGDGAGHPDDGQLIIRNMLPSSDFEHAIQNVDVTGDEEAVMGEYFPKIQYMSREEFEALGFRPWKNLPY